MTECPLISGVDRVFAADEPEPFAADMREGRKRRPLSFPHTEQWQYVRATTFSISNLIPPQMQLPSDHRYLRLSTIPLPSVDEPRDEDSAGKLERRHRYSCHR
jgi:hypothetical protein